jgi:hypothetical protein
VLKEISKMEYNGQYMGVDKIIITNWSKKENDYSHIYKAFTIDTDLCYVKTHLNLLKKQYARVNFKVLKETWQDNSWSDYEDINID